jgi:S1-C subfamily serine protease
MAPLAAFLYRRAEREMFRGGIQPMAVEMKTRPATGVFVEKDSYWSRTAGLRAGDIIVGIDGLKVENFEQLDAVLWFKPEAKTYQFTAWRGVLFTVDIPANHGMTLKTHPLKGWIE